MKREGLERNRIQERIGIQERNRIKNQIVEALAQEFEAYGHIGRWKDLQVRVTGESLR